MAYVKIADNSHEVSDEVYQWMKNARDIINLAKRLRDAQIHYFKYRNNLDQCKAIEKEFDDLLAGRTPEKQTIQAELFR